MSESVKAEVDELKTSGNALVQSGKFDEAIEAYSKAIKLDPNNQVLYSNRSAAYAKKRQGQEALDDAVKTLEIKPDWAKGYSRKGSALTILNRYEEAVLAFEEGLKLDPNNEQLKQGLHDAEDQLIGPGGSQPIGSPFSDPNVIAKLKMNPKTSSFCEDPAFVAKIEMLRKDPKLLGTLMSDQRVLTAMGVLLGVDLTGLRPGDSDDQETSTRPPPSKFSKTDTPSSSKSAKNSSPVEEKGMAEKELGNKAYKSKDFATAHVHYSKAIEIDPTNIIFRNNKAAVYFEEGKFDEAIKECEEAVSVGRQNKADFKLIAKSLARIGSCYHKKNDLEKALTFYNKSLAEHRAPDIVKKTQELTKFIKEQERLAQIDPEESLKQKNAGNESFKKGDYPSAIKFYTEAIKKNPDDAKLYSNRSACYTKLAEFEIAIRDCDQCIKIDPSFIKGYLRKGANLLAMKEYKRASQAYEKAMDLDPECSEAIDGYRKCAVNESGDPEKIRQQAMQDPEIQAIFKDPAMQMILQQMQSDPSALKEHLQNPAIASKIQKLMQSGLISIR